MQEQIVLASGNRHKIAELKKIWKDISLFDAGSRIFDEIDENGNSFEENALIKARAVSHILRRR
jgi:XTP/dITP diphosphohydrolase